MRSSLEKFIRHRLWSKFFIKQSLEIADNRQKAALQRDEELVSSRIGIETFHEDTKLFSQTISIEVSNVIDLIMDPRVSVLLAPDEMLADLPPCHIYAASHDILLDDAVLFHKAAVDAGNENIKEWIELKYVILNTEGYVIHM